VQRDSETHAIIEAGMEVHGRLGPGFLERVYQEAFDVELTDRGIPFAREVLMPVSYKDRLLAVRYRIDFLCYDSIIVEIKATKVVSPVDYAQVINYLKASGYQRALLLNFGSRSLQYHRLVNTTNDQSA
jgi:GxxExxY protein